MPVQATRTLIGKGIYDSDEVAHLTGASVREVSRWASAPENGGGLLFPSDRRLFTFWDLITARVTKALMARRVPVASTRDARDDLAARLDSEWPLAHYAVLRQLGNVGRNVYADPDGDGRWMDATLGGQLPLDKVTDPLLQRIEFDEASGLAASWSPYEGVVLRPTVQAGAPCVEGTRVSTAMLADLVRQGEDVEDLADDYELDPEAVRRAIAYEEELAHAA